MPSTRASARIGSASLSSANPLASPASLSDYGPDDIFLRAKWITDLDLGYNLTKDLNVAIGAKNLFDVYPKKQGVPSSTMVSNCRQKISSIRCAPRSPASFTSIPMVASAKAAIAPITHAGDHASDRMAPVAIAAAA